MVSLFKYSVPLTENDCLQYLMQNNLQFVALPSDQDETDVDKVKHFLAFGNYRISPDSFYSAFDAVDWLTSHWIRVAVTILEICDLYKQQGLLNRKNEESLCQDQEEEDVTKDVALN